MSVCSFIWMTSIIDKEGGGASGAMNFVVIGEFCCGQPIKPIVLAIVYEEAKVLFDFLIHTLGLSVGLGVICGRGVHFDSNETIKILHELVNKLWSSIADNFSW